MAPAKFSFALENLGRKLSKNYDEDEKEIELKEDNEHYSKEHDSDSDSYENDATSKGSEHKPTKAGKDDPNEDKKEEELKHQHNHPESQQRDLKIRHILEKIMLQTVYGSIIEATTGMLAWSSSLVYLILTFFGDMNQWFDIIDLIL